MRVLVIPEDFRQDQYILKPLFDRLFRTTGMGAARIVICQDPLLGGIGEALKTDRLHDVISRYPMTDIFILCVDRDGEETRRRTLDHIEATFGPRFLAVNAWEEIETWVLAGLVLPNHWQWSEVRAEVHVKESFFYELAEQRGLMPGSDRGRQARQVLGHEASRNIHAIRQKCPEDLDALARRLESLR